MRMGGPREALLHALIRKNFGCTHIIIGRDHAGPGNDSNGNPFYGPYDAQELLNEHKEEIGIEIVPFKFMVYTPKDGKYKPLESLEEKNEFTIRQRKSRKNHLERLARGRVEALESSDLHLETGLAFKEFNSHIASIAYPILAREGKLLNSRLISEN